MMTMKIGNLYKTTDVEDYYEFSFKPPENHFSNGIFDVDSIFLLLDIIFDKERSDERRKCYWFKVLCQNKICFFWRSNEFGKFEEIFVSV